MSLDGDVIHYVCNGAKECVVDCGHKTPHVHNSLCEIKCDEDGVFGASCVEHIFETKMNANQAQELINVINMAAGEGCEFVFTENLAKKLGEFIDGGV